MHSRQHAVLDALQRTQRYLEENADLLTHGVDLTAGRRRLDEVVTTFSADVFDQDVSARGARAETANQRRLRIALRQQHMKPIAVIARQYLRDRPEFVALRMPEWSLRGEPLIVSALCMADAATAHEDTFVAHGLPSTFREDLRSAVAELEASLSDREKNLVRRRGATTGLRFGTRNGRTILNVLDALVRRAVGENQSLWRAWQATRRIGRSIRD